MTARLPVTLPPLHGELLSSWLGRHAEFYGVTPLTMLHHCLPEAASLRAIDLTINKSQANRIGEWFSIGSQAVRKMTFVDCPTDARRFIAKEPIQRCSRCNPNTSRCLPVLRSELQGWRINCPHCELQFQPSTVNNYSSLFATYRAAALRGEKLLHAHAERSKESWFAPLEIARLLLMRRIPWPIPSTEDLWRHHSRP